jgi:hypothetical protein
MAGCPLPAGAALINTGTLHLKMEEALIHKKKGYTCSLLILCRYENAAAEKIFETY